MDDGSLLSRRQVLKAMAASGVIAAADLTWWEEPLIRPRRAWGAAPVRFSSACPSPSAPRSSSRSSSASTTRSRTSR